VFYEPLWIFHRGGLQGETMAAMRGRKISIGSVGSGSRAILMQMLKRNDIDQGFAEFLPLSPQEGADKLLAGEIDAVALLAAWDAPVVQRLIADERVELVNMARADAYVALYPFLSKATIPRGVGDLAKDLPPNDVTVFASTASLVVHKDVHPAIQYLLLSAAMQVHSGVSMFHRGGRFPAAEGIELPLSSEAVQFYKSGLPFLQNNLPFWMASLVGRLLVLLIPIVAVLYPMMRFLPAMYGWMMRRKIARLYGELRFLEDEITAARAGNAAELMARLDDLESQANQLRMPIAYESMLYLLRNHIGVVRNRLAAPAAPQST
jgi:hypothetical protein